jgi:hypothetical protein
MSDVTPDPTSVYKYYDQNNLLLYVGITRRGVVRNREHNASKEWWQFVVRQDVEHYPHRLAAEERERHLIRAFRPPFNKQHNPDHEELRAIYFAAGRERISLVPSDARKILAQVHHKLPLHCIDIRGARAVYACRPEHMPLASVLRWETRVLLLAPKKVAVLMDVIDGGDRVAFEFHGDKRIPKLTDVRLHVKARSHKPLMVDIHEATATEVAA